MVLHRSGDIVHPCLIHDLGEKALSLSPLGMMLAIIYFVDAFYQVLFLPCQQGGLLWFFLKYFFIMNSC